MSLILFETTESVIEVLWDLALAFFILRISLIYFLLTFTTGTLLTYLLTLHLRPITHLTTPQTELALIPVHCLLMALWARAVIAYYEVPRVAGFRLAIGAVAAGFLIGAEMMVGFVLYEEGWAAWIGETDWRAGLAFGGSLGWCALLPWLLMGVERREEGGRTAHGHEKKSVLNAVPTVSKTGKDQSKKTQ